MIKAKKRLIIDTPRIKLNVAPTIQPPSEPSLLMQRLHELDDEFSRQAHQLAQLTRDLAKKFTKKL